MTATPYVLVLGGSSDGQLVGVVDQLRMRGATVVFLDHETTVNSAVVFDGPRSEPRLVVDGERLATPSVIWCRIKIRSILGAWTPETLPEHLKRVEWRAFTIGLAEAFPDRLVYAPSAAWSAEHKISQLAHAARVGFRIPQSSFFVGKAQATDFMQAQPALVAKPLESRNYPSLAHIDRYRMLITMRVDSEQVAAASAEEFEQCPTYFQRELKSGVELRVLGFKDRSFTYRVNTGVAGRTRPDERFIMDHRYTLIPTPPRMQEMITGYLEQMHLGYGAFDIIEEERDSYVFLECNPEGQWWAANGINTTEVAGHFAETILSRMSRPATRAADAMAASG